MAFTSFCPTTLPTTKATWRKTLRVWRDALPKISRRASANRLSAHGVRWVRQQGLQRIALYVAHGSEINAWPWINALQRAGKAVYLPTLAGHGRRLSFVKLSKHPRWRKNRYGIAELSGCRVSVRRLDCVVVPLLGIDLRGTRLGMGAGFYDTTLIRTGVKTIGVGYRGQYQQTLPQDVWDVPLAGFISDAGWQKVKR